MKLILLKDIDVGLDFNATGFCGIVNYPGHEVSNVDCVDASGRARCHDWNMGRVRKGGESEEGYVLIGVL